jgi:NitT/TauT family transport system ATP-binding protein
VEQTVRNPQPDLILREVSKSFGDNQVIDQYSAVFPGGALTGLMGPSGCGKTTLLRLLMGLLEPDRGMISGIPARKSAVFQEDRLCPSFSAVANVRLACHHDLPRATIEAHLTSIGLGDSLHQPVCELSGGMQRRVAIVRAILAESDILYLDEPFKGLDRETRETVMTYVRQHLGGRTVVLVTHDAAEIEALGGRPFNLPMLKGGVPSDEDSL